MTLLYRGTVYQSAPSLEVAAIQPTGKYRGVPIKFTTAASRSAHSIQPLTYRGVTYAGLR